VKPLWVLDTNVLVSALLSKQGPPAKVWEALGAGRYLLAYDPRILHEYQQVLSRPKFGFIASDVADLFGMMARFGEIVMPAVMLPALSDPDDTPFLEVAASTPDKVLVTGNVKHYPGPARHGVAVFSPSEALALLRSARMT
jgi:putative PIN family toxin of toxin-antitoxin system